MAHGFGGTRDTWLLGYAEAFADAGIGTLLLPGVDPDRVIVWGTSYSGGHVLAVGLNRPTTFAGRVSCPILFQIGRRSAINCGFCPRFSHPSPRPIASGRHPQSIDNCDLTNVGRA